MRNGYRGMVVGFAALTALVSGGMAMAADWKDEPVLRTELVTGFEAVAPGQTVPVAVRVDLAEGWHTYWINPGDSGMPPRLNWTLPEGWTAGPIRHPTPIRIDEPPFVTFGFEGRVLFVVDVQVPAAAVVGSEVRLTGAFQFLICKEICVPRKAELGLTLRVEPQPRAAAADAVALMAEAAKRLPTTQPDWTVTAGLTADTLKLQVALPAATDPARLKDVAFLPETAGLIDYWAEVGRHSEPGRYVLTFKRSGETEFKAPMLRGLLVTDAGKATMAAIQIEAPVTPAP